MNVPRPASVPLRGRSVAWSREMTRQCKPLRPGSLGPCPDAEGLRAAAVSYLARYSATRASLRRVLERKIDRWARDAQSEGTLDAEAIAALAAEARVTAQSVVLGLAEARAVDDLAFAQSRVRSLLRSGHSRRAAAAHLAAKGVEHETARTVLSDESDAELTAALVFARRRRIGPFRLDRTGAETQRGRELATLARAGFSRNLATAVLRMDPSAAQDLIDRSRNV